MKRKIEGIYFPLPYGKGYINVTINNKGVKLIIIPTTYCI